MTQSHLLSEYPDIFKHTDSKSPDNSNELLIDFHTFKFRSSHLDVNLYNDIKMSRSVSKSSSELSHLDSGYFSDTNNSIDRQLSSSNASCLSTYYARCLNGELKPLDSVVSAQFHVDVNETTKSSSLEDLPPSESTLSRRAKADTTKPASHRVFLLLESLWKSKVNKGIYAIKSNFEKAVNGVKNLPQKLQKVDTGKVESLCQPEEPSMNLSKPQTSSNESRPIRRMSSRRPQKRPPTVYEVLPEIRECTLERTKTIAASSLPGVKWGFAACTRHIKRKDHGINLGEEVVFGMKYELDWTHQTGTNRIADGKNADIAADSYIRMKEDVDLLASMNIQLYRILPRGTLDGGINQQGVDFYNNLINKLIAKGITPIVTLYHWDLPSPIQSYGGWLNSTIIADFTAYARLLFGIYGDRVKYWLTFNEPSTGCDYGYGDGTFAPGVVGGESGKFTCVHNTLLAHASAAETLRLNFANQGGKISFPVVTNWYEPATTSANDIMASNLKTLQIGGWQWDPVIFGDYPLELKNYFPALPKFTNTQKLQLKGSIDFIAVNYYTGFIATYNGGSDICQCYTSIPPGAEQAASTWLYVYPYGMRRLLQWLKARYGSMKIWVTENGEQISQSPNDTQRIMFFQKHLEQLSVAIKTDLVNVKAYLAWSLLDNFEWNRGYLERFGVVGVDYNGGTLKRTIKTSAYWLRNFWSGALQPDAVTCTKNEECGSGCCSKSTLTCVRGLSASVCV
ncbi:hypothetical protein HK098_004917, partial [Nowakowskiella sp. JEL0407]